MAYQIFVKGSDGKFVSQNMQFPTAERAKNYAQRNLLLKIFARTVRVCDVALGIGEQCDYLPGTRPIWRPITRL